jgi:hypothetical protein
MSSNISVHNTRNIKTKSSLPDPLSTYLIGGLLAFIYLYWLSFLRLSPIHHQLYTFQLHTYVDTITYKFISHSTLNII